MSEFKTLLVSALITCFISMAGSSVVWAWSMSTFKAEVYVKIEQIFSSIDEFKDEQGAIKTKVGKVKEKSNSTFIILERVDKRQQDHDTIIDEHGKTIAILWSQYE